MDRWTWHICQCVCCCWSLQVYRYRSDKPTTQATSALKPEAPQFELFHSHLLQRKVESFGLICSLQVRPSPSVLPTLPWQCYVSCTVHISCQYKRLGKQIWLFRWFAFYEAVISLPWISDDQILSALDMYGTEPFVHELSVKLACMWYYILRAHKLAKYSAHNSFM